MLIKNNSPEVSVPGPGGETINIRLGMTRVPAVRTEQAMRMNKYDSLSTTMKRDVQGTGRTSEQMLDRYILANLRDLSSRIHDWSKMLYYHVPI